MNRSARRSHRPFATGIWVSLAAALVWSVLLAVAAATVPVYGSEQYVGSATFAAGSGRLVHRTESVTHTSATLVQVNGSSAWIALGWPMLITVAVGVALLRPRSGRIAGVVGWVCTGLLGAFTALSMLTLGPWLVPVPVALTIACALHTGRAWA